MPTENLQLFISLLILSLIRFSGFLVSLDLLFRKREQKYILFIIAWLAGLVGPLLGILTLYDFPNSISNYLWLMFSLLAGISTILIVFGALSYFRKFRTNYIIFIIFIFIVLAVLLKLIYLIDISTSFALTVQSAFLIFLIVVIISQRKLFIKHARVSYYWLLGIAVMGIGHTLGFIFIYKDQSLGFVGTSFLAVLTIIFILHLENDLSFGKLKDSNQYRKTLFEQSPIGLSLTTMEGRLVDVNIAYTAMIGRTRKETLDLSYWDITPEKYSDQEVLQLKSLDDTGRYGPYEKEYIHKDGHLFPVRLQGLIIERNGENYIWSSTEDITKQKQAKEELSKHKEHLEELVKERTKELGERNADLERFNKLFIDREFRIKELRDRVKELEGKSI